MKKILLAASLLSIAVASPALAKEKPLSFSYDGVNYTYTVKELSEERKLIEGNASPGKSFRLVVSGGRVFGTANGMPVSFRVKDAVALADVTTEVASR